MKYHGLCRHAETGFSIVELVVVIGILGILLSIGTINFSQWQVKHSVEAQVRRMVTDFSELRVQAFTKKQRHSITVNKLDYTFKSYTSEGEDLTTGGTQIPPNVRTVSFPLKSNATTDYNGTVFEIDSRGLLQGTIGTIYLDYKNASPAVDCLTVHFVRINQGKRDAAWSKCDDK